MKSCLSQLKSPVVQSVALNRMVRKLQATGIQGDNLPSLGLLAPPALEGLSSSALRYPCAFEAAGSISMRSLLLFAEGTLLLSGTTMGTAACCSTKYCPGL